jgi:hypothetical protein
MVMTFDVRDNSENVSDVCKIIFGKQDNDYLLVDRTISILDIRDEQRRYCLRIEDIDELIKALQKAKEFYGN